MFVSTFEHTLVTGVYQWSFVSLHDCKADWGRGGWGGGPRGVVTGKQRGESGKVVHFRALTQKASWQFRTISNSSVSDWRVMCNCC